MLRPLIFLLPILSPAWGMAADFKKDIAPIFKSKCYECHSEQAKKEKNGYVFDNLERLAGDIRPSGMIDPGRPGESPLMELITLPEGDKRHMPPGGSLSTKQIKSIREWIQQGALLDKKSAAKPSGLPIKPAPKAPEPAPESWISSDGKAITAVFVSLEGEIVVLKMNGKPYRVPLAKLSEASRLQATQRKP
jgi:hypothetical protein